jgi:hypothetical protein
MVTQIVVGQSFRTFDLMLPVCRMKLQGGRRMPTFALNCEVGCDL